MRGPAPLSCARLTPGDPLRTHPSRPGRPRPRPPACAPASRPARGTRRRRCGLVWRSAPGRRRGAGGVHDRRGRAAAVRRLGRQADHRCRGRGARGRAGRGARGRAGAGGAAGRARAGRGGGDGRLRARARRWCASSSALRLGIDLNVRILEKAEKLSLRHFEDAEFYDKLTRARREASTPAAVADPEQLPGRSATA